MFKLPLMLLLQRGMFLKTLREQGIAWTGIAAMAGFIAATCALYGAVMAFWSSPLLALYSAAKLPLVFAGSTAAVAVFNWMVAVAFGSGLAFRETVALDLGGACACGMAFRGFDGKPSVCHLFDTVGLGCGAFIHGQVHSTCLRGWIGATEPWVETMVLHFDGCYPANDHGDAPVVNPSES